jgi:hypothetical protein
VSRLRPTAALAALVVLGVIGALAAPGTSAPAAAKPKAPEPSPLEGCKREEHGGLVTFGCGPYSVFDGLMPGKLQRKTADSLLQLFAGGFPQDAQRDQVAFEAGGQKYPSLRVSGDHGPRGPFQAQLVLVPAGGKTRTLSCGGPHPGGGPDRCRAILVFLIAAGR